MNRYQKLLLGIYLPLTAVFMILDHLFPGANFVNYLKFSAIITLFLFVCRVKKYFPEQKTLTMALFYSNKSISKKLSIRPSQCSGSSTGCRLKHSGIFICLSLCYRGP